MKIIDCRCRYTGGNSAEYFVDRMRSVDRLERIPALASQHEEDFFSEITQAGVTTAVSVSGFNPGARIGRFNFPDRTTSNDELSQVQERHPGRFLAVGGIDVSNNFHDSISETARCVQELGMKAVTIEPGRSPGCLLNDPKLFPFYDLCQTLDITIIPHSGPKAGSDLDHAHPRYIEEIADAFPNLRIISGHGCYPFVREAIVAASRRDNIWLAPDGYFFHLGHDDWMRAINKNLMDFSERFVFASAFPLTPINAFVKNFLKLDWNTAVIENILFRNAINALNLQSDPVYIATFDL
ncbi:amidohydrolase family protein [Synechococcus sp. CCY 9618]|uniref:amidohydrolase family protein n=1 Tax=Synechococcus sp. CCY 9618 TaxID=2815602 RepID=UPI001C24D779|nr:amidohydrolase family protein [Synechococcus sp. CCY 9618]